MQAEDKLENVEFTEDIEKAVSSLDNISRKILYYYYYRSLSYNANAIRLAALENKVVLLLSMMEEYDLTTAQKIQQVANYIERTALPYFEDLQWRLLHKLLCG